MPSSSDPEPHPLVVVIGGNIDVLHAANEESIPVALIHDSTRPNFSTAMPGLCEHFYDIDFTTAYDHVRTAVLGLHSHQPVTAVLSLDEDGLLPAARLTSELELRGNSLDAVEASVDKATMRDRMRTNGIPCLNFALCSTEEDFRSTVAEFNGDVVAKPTSSTGSLDVEYVGNDTAVAVWASYTAKGYQQVLVEQRAHGHEFSIDTLSIDGNHFLLAVTRKYMIGTLEAGHSIPGDLGHDQKQTLDLVYNLLDCLGIAHGPAHTEIMLTPSGPAIIETQTRIGGSRLPELMKWASGIDVTRLSLLVALNRLRTSGPNLATMDAAGGAAVRYFLPTAGRITSIDGRQHFLDQPDYRLNFKNDVGDEVIEQKNSHDRNQVGIYVVARGVDEADAINKCDKAIETIHIISDTPSHGPA